MSTLFTHRILDVDPFSHDPVLGDGTEPVSVSVHCSVAVQRPVVFTFVEICTNKLEDPKPAIGLI